MAVKLVADGELAQVAAFMARVKPEWWGPESALTQLNGCLTWVTEGHGQITAWVACRDLKGYRTLEIETMGSDVGGGMVVGAGLNPIMQACEEWAMNRGYANIRYTRSSTGLSCHGRDGSQLGSLSEELHRISVTSEARSYDWMLSLGYEPAAVLPDIYARGIHGVMLVKRLVTHRN